jgi:hypothetical protein
MHDLPEDIIPEGSPGATTGHALAHEWIHTQGNVAPVAIPCVTDGVTDNAALIQNAIAAEEPGTKFILPAGPIGITPVVADQLANVEGHGRGGTILVCLGNSADAYWEWDFPSATLYSRLAHVGFDLSASPNGTAFRAGPNAFWWTLEDVNIEGGTIGIDSQAMNGRVHWVRAADITTAFLKAIEGGLELTLEHFIMERLVAGTSVDGILIDAPGVGTIKGAVYGHDVRFAKVTGTAACALRAISDDDPGFTVPLFFERAVFDNINGPAVDLTGTWRSVFANSWFASAAGTASAVQVDGGGQLQFLGNQLFGGSGGAGCSYEFLGDPDRITSIGNHLHTGPSYRITGGQPTNMLLDDDHYGGLLSNDMAKLYAAKLSRGNVRSFKQVTTEAGLSTLAGSPSEIFVAHTGVDAAASQFTIDRRVLVGTAGHLYVKSVTTGVGFTLASTTDETSTLWWELKTAIL